MAIQLRVDVYLHHADASLLQEVLALTQTLKARNDQLAQAVSELTGQNAGGRNRTSTSRGVFEVSTNPMQQVIEDLRVEIERNTSIDGSAITLMNGLAARIEELKNDPTALQELANSIRTSNDALSAAVRANTPAVEGGAEPTPPEGGEAQA
jgi:FtsZ-binding cell division protein ZapB